MKKTIYYNLHWLSYKIAELANKLYTSKQRQKMAEKRLMEFIFKKKVSKT